jgi:pilus assembly protein CpaD
MMRTTIMILSAAALAGCAGAWNGPEHAMTIAEEHPIAVDSQTVTLTLDIDAGADLSAIDRARLRAFGDSYLNSGHGPLNVAAPSGTSDDRAGEALAAKAREYLNEIGVDYSAMSGAAYRAGDDRGRQLVLSYTRYVATGPACGNWAGLKARDFANLRSPNFGCATQNNIAALVADPHDLVEPTDEASADAMARIRGLKAYREGDKTASETDTDIKADVAQ